MAETASEIALFQMGAWVPATAAPSQAHQAGAQPEPAAHAGPPVWAAEAAALVAEAEGVDSLNAEGILEIKRKQGI